MINLKSFFPLRSKPKYLAMEFIEQINDSVIELLEYGCRKEDIVIKFSPLVKRYLEQILYENYHVQNKIFSSFMGVRIADDWPYNEVVVYDAKNVCYYPKMIRVKKCPLELQNPERSVATEVKSRYKSR